MKTYRVSILDADGRWLVSQDFPDQPSRDQISQIPALSHGRSEIRVSIVRGSKEYGWYAYQQGEGRGLADVSDIHEARRLALTPPDTLRKAHYRLDAAEEAVARARVLTSEVSAEYADAGHAYYAILLAADLASAASIHNDHYETCRPQIRQRVERDLVSRGVIRVLSDGTWAYL